MQNLHLHLTLLFMFGSLLINIPGSHSESESNLCPERSGAYWACGFTREGPGYARKRRVHGGEYKGSTLSILGRNALDDKVREVPIVGGTGGFRMARGYAVTTTYAVDKAHTHGVIEYNVVVVHYDDAMMQ
ncbi:UNVERIFIED_CONTAM: Dirigent protein 19 [Sesamum latifolium]|uniref:Dirigent protein n=1 Tax=Sesamum latifolium TaxID=2727402 RepID=A0AAW2XJK8_9LAMI